MISGIRYIFPARAGEGLLPGHPAVFCRFAGCNLWSGRESDRATAACNFCDTDFVGVDGEGGGRFDGPQALADAVEHMWRGVGGRRFVVLTRGEARLRGDDVFIA